MTGRRRSAPRAAGREARCGRRYGARVRRWTHILVWVVGLLSCGGDPIEVVDPASIPANPTWVDDVAPLLDRYCQSCHSADTLGGAPDGLDFRSYDRTVCEWGDVYETVLRDRSMPPAGAQRPTARELALLERWGDQGQPRGDGDTTPPNCRERDDED